jgi:hypothetical protein
MKTALDFLHEDPSVSGSFKKAVRVVDDCTAILKADNDAARIATEAKWYASECFAGRLTEWPEWIGPDRMKAATRELDSALRAEPDSALLRSQLILSRLINEAAAAHAQRCHDNGWPQ